MTAIRYVVSSRTRDGSCSVHTDVGESTGLTMAEECDAMPGDGLWKDDQLATPLKATGHTLGVLPGSLP